SRNVSSSPLPATGRPSYWSREAIPVPVSIAWTRFSATEIEQSSPLSTNVERGLGGEANVERGLGGEADAEKGIGGEVTFPRCRFPSPAAALSPWPPAPLPPPPWPTGSW